MAHERVAAELVAWLVQSSRASAIWLLAIMAVTAAPALLGDRLPVRIPAEYELLAILFVFAALFLGEFHGYYERYWWWDIALHTVSGLLLGIVGFLLVYMLNESRHTIHMRAGFVALFAFVFAVRWFQRRLRFYARAARRWKRVCSRWAVSRWALVAWLVARGMSSEIFVLALVHLAMPVDVRL